MNRTFAQDVLLLLDFQIVGLGMMKAESALLDQAAEALAVYRRSGQPVVHAMLGFSEDYRELDKANITLGPLHGSGAMRLGQPATGIHPGVAPNIGETCVVKHRVNAFFNSDLQDTLEELGATQVTIAGIATSGAVLSTALHAADLDYNVRILDDCCRDFDVTLHQAASVIMQRRGIQIARLIDLDAELGNA